MTFTPDYYKQTYLLSCTKKTYQQYSLISYEKLLLPETIRIEINNGYNAIKGAYYLLRIRNQTHWKDCSLSGLRETETPNFHYADFQINGKKSLCIVEYNPEGDKIEILVCKEFDLSKNPKQRDFIINKIINNL